MSLVDRAMRRAMRLLGVLALAVPGAALAAIVVASSGPSAKSFPVGKQLDAGATITLKAGDSITILDGKGTRVLSGAGTYAVSGQGAATKAVTFSILTRQRAAGRVRTGAVRDPGAVGPVRSPNLWYVDVSRLGKQCVIDPAMVRLWRVDSALPARFDVTPAGGGTSVAISFPAGTSVAPWDAAAAPVTDGASYAVTDGRGHALGKVEFVVLSAQPADAEGMAAVLIEKGCNAQLDLLSASLAAASR